MTTSLHITDVRAYKSCRRRHHWSSHLGDNLEPLITPWPFMLGRAVHFGLAAYNETGEHPTDAFLRMMEAARKQNEAEAGELWEAELITYQEQVDLGKGMLDHYLSWVRNTNVDDKWETVATEMPFSVPIPIPLQAQGQMNIGEASGFVLEGRLDGIVRHKQTGKLWIREYKTASRMPEPEVLHFDDQNAAYAWAVSQILGEPVAGIHYRFLAKKVPEEPRVLKSGTLSKQVSTTTYAKYVETLRKYSHGKESVFNQLMDDYADVLATLLPLGGKGYFMDALVVKAPEELAAIAEELYYVGAEMTNPATPIYASPEWLKCSWCAFKEPCANMNKGRSNATLLKHGFRTRQAADEFLGTVDSGEPV
jgi:hypothetical protein